MDNKVSCICCGEEIEDGYDYYIVDRQYPYCSEECIEATEDMRKEHEIKKYIRKEDN